MGPVEDIVRVVAEAEGSNRSELPPLGEAIDTDALDSLVDSGEDVRVTFQYCGYKVMVQDDGTIELF